MYDGRDTRQEGDENIDMRERASGERMGIFSTKKERRKKKRVTAEGVEPSCL